MRQTGLPGSEAQRGSVTCPRSPFKKGSQRGLAVRAAWLWLPGRVDPRILHQGREDLWVSGGAQETQETIRSQGVRVTGHCTAGLGKHGPPTRPQDCLLWPLRVLAGRGGTALPPRNKGVSLPSSRQLHIPQGEQELKKFNFPSGSVRRRAPRSGGGKLVLTGEGYRSLGSSSAGPRHEAPSSLRCRSSGPQPLLPRTRDLSSCSGHLRAKIPASSTGSHRGPEVTGPARRSPPSQQPRTPRALT